MRLAIKLKNALCWEDSAPNYFLTRTTMSADEDSGKLYHLKCTGDALVTAEAHAAQADITLFAGCFCPFVQRVWVALEYLGHNYQVSLPEIRLILFANEFTVL